MRKDISFYNKDEEMRPELSLLCWLVGFLPIFSMRWRLMSRKNKLLFLPLDSTLCNASRREEPAWHIEILKSGSYMYINSSLSRGFTKTSLQFFFFFIRKKLNPPIRRHLAENKDYFQYIQDASGSHTPSLTPSRLLPLAYIFAGVTGKTYFLIHTVIKYVGACV